MDNHQFCFDPHSGPDLFDSMNEDIENNSWENESENNAEKREAVQAAMMGITTPSTQIAEYLRKNAGTNTDQIKLEESDSQVDNSKFNLEGEMNRDSDGDEQESYESENSQGNVQQDLKTESIEDVFSQHAFKPTLAQPKPSEDFIMKDKPGVAGVPITEPNSTKSPVYVNPKQYERIMRRRIARARLEEMGRLSQERKPYLHESRHKHALRRPRGPRGRFLTKEELEAERPNDLIINPT